MTTTISYDIIYVFSVLAVAIVLFISDRIRLDVVAVLVILALSLGGILTPREAVSGFGEPIVLMIAALFIVGEGMFHTGIAFSIGDIIVRIAGKRETGLILVLMLAVAGLSAFMSSTGAVAIFIPVAVRLATKAGLSPGRLLMPMAFGALIGGMLTLIGTPPNLVASAQLAKAGLEPFGFFEFTPIGLIILAVAMGYMVLIGRHILPKSEIKQSEGTERRTLMGMAETYGIADHLICIHIDHGSPLIGQTIAKAALRTKYGVTVFGVERHSHLHKTVKPAMVQTVFRDGDILFAVDSNRRTEPLANEQSVTVSQLDDRHRNLMARELGLADVLLTPHSGLIGHTLKEIDFRKAYNLGILSILRKGEPIVKNFADVSLEFGDTILLGGSWERIHALQNRKKDFLVMSLPEEMAENAPGRDRASIAIAIIAIMLGVMTFKLAPTVITVLSAALAMVMLKCVPFKKLYKSINWESLVLIAGMLPMAKALDKTGGLELIVDQIMLLIGDSSPILAMITLFVITSVFSQVISNTATTVLIAPVALAISTI